VACMAWQTDSMVLQTILKHRKRRGSPPPGLLGDAQRTRLRTHPYVPGLPIAASLWHRVEMVQTRRVDAWGNQRTGAVAPTSADDRAARGHALKVLVRVMVVLLIALLIAEPLDLLIAKVEVLLLIRRVP
jgi:hypothetical protein